MLKAIIKDCLKTSSSPTIVIKSTVSIGFTKSLKQELGVDNIIFSPEFLREGKALYDNLYPIRIIIGEKLEVARGFANLLKDGTFKKRCSNFIYGLYRSKKL
ncbi:MAG: hypothetical protein AB8V03_05600 [Francisella endosymbiont of Hyalomma asiaticum]